MDFVIFESEHQFHLILIVFSTQQQYRRIYLLHVIERVQCDTNHQKKKQQTVRVETQTHTQKIVLEMSDEIRIDRIKIDDHKLIICK